MRRTLAATTLLAGLLLATPPMARAQFGSGIVFDPTNWGTNLATQVNTLKSTLNEGQMIANQAKAMEYQVKSLLNEATNLQQNPLRLLGRIQGMWDAYNQIMSNAEGTAFAMTQASTRFEASYPALATGSVQEVSGHLKAMLQSVRASTKTAVQTQSVYERLCNELDANQHALTAAQASTGALQIAQAQAQIQALTNEQLSTLTQIEAASSRVETEWIAMQVKERVDAAAVNTRFVEGLDRGFKGIGQTTGVNLR